MPGPSKLESVAGPRRPCAVLQQFRALNFPGAYTYTPPAPRLRPPPPAPRWGCAVSPCRAPPAAAHAPRYAPRHPRRRRSSPLPRAVVGWLAGKDGRDGCRIGLSIECQRQSGGRAARMRFAGGFSPDGGTKARGRTPATRQAGGRDGQENRPKPQSGLNPYLNQYWLAENPLTKY